MNFINLKNKKVLITGGTAGIGLSILESFYKLEADIFTIGTNVENLKDIQSSFPKIKTSNFNLENHQKIEELVKEVKEKLGGLDIVINNAGITKDNLAIRMSDEEWNKVININLTAVFLICKYRNKIYPHNFLQLLHAYQNNHNTQLVSSLQMISLACTIHGLCNLF